MDCNFHKYYSQKHQLAVCCGSILWFTTNLHPSVTHTEASDITTDAIWENIHTNKHTHIYRIIGLHCVSGMWAIRLQFLDSTSYNGSCFKRKRCNHVCFLKLHLSCLVCMLLCLDHRRRSPYCQAFKCARGFLHISLNTCMYVCVCVCDVMPRALCKIHSN